MNFYSKVILLCIIIVWCSQSGFQISIEWGSWRSRWRRQPHEMQLNWKMSVGVWKHSKRYIAESRKKQLKVMRRDETVGDWVMSHAITWHCKAISDREKWKLELEAARRFLGHSTSSVEIFAPFPMLSDFEARGERRMTMIFGSRFSRDFLWYHILSGKIITFSLPVMDIYILKAALSSLPQIDGDFCLQVKVADVAVGGEFDVNMGRWCSKWRHWFHYL